MTPPVNAPYRARVDAAAKTARNATGRDVESPFLELARLRQP